MGSIAQRKLPVIDLSSKNLTPGSSSGVTTCAEVMQALEEFGCFIAIFDGVSDDLQEEIFGASKQLFDLPTEVKVLNTLDTPTQGYVGQLPNVPLLEALGIEHPLTKEGVEGFTKLMWPSGNQSFSETAMKFANAVSELDLLVKRIVAKSYGIEEHYESLLGSTSRLLKFLKYTRPQGDEGNLGLYPHTDTSFTSILHQDGVKGLEIKTKDGEWLPVDHIPSSFLFFAGDAFMAWTNARIESPFHRVLIQDQTEDRYSMGFFSFIRDRDIHTPQELVDEDHPLQFKPFDNYKYIHYGQTDEAKKSKCAIRSYCGISV